MTDDKKRYKDPELERFFRDNMEMVETLLREEREMVKRLLAEERSNIEKLISEQKEKGEDTVKKTMDMFTDPDVQRHFMAMGMEFMLGLTALVKASPLPDVFKDAVDRTEGSGKTATKETAKRNSAASKDVQKVDIKDTKTRTKAKAE